MGGQEVFVTASIGVSIYPHDGEQVDEGVETEAQQRFLARLDCDFMQGFLYSRPLNALGIVEYLKGGASRGGGPPRRTGGGRGA